MPEFFSIGNSGLGPQPGWQGVENFASLRAFGGFNLGFGLPRPPVEAEFKLEKFCADARSLWPKVDSNGDNILSCDELASAVSNPLFVGNDALVVAALYRVRKLFPSAKTAIHGESEGGRHQCGSVSQDDIDKLESHPEANSAEDFSIETLSRVFSERFDDIAILRRELRSAMRPRSLSDVSLLLYADQVNPLLSIRPEAVLQGAVGNCYFAAALAALAAANPMKIYQMIEQETDSTYRVVFPGDRESPIITALPTEGELSLYSGANSYGLWPCLLEKAYGQYLQNSQNESHCLPPQELSAGGGRPERVLSLFSAGDAYFVPRHDLDMPTLGQHIKDALAEGRAVTVSTGGLESSWRFRVGHAFSVLAYDPKGPDGGTITVRDPLGNGLLLPFASMSMSLLEFYQSFPCVEFEGRRLKSRDNQ